MIGWLLLGVWLTSLRIRLQNVLKIPSMKEWKTRCFALIVLVLLTIHQPSSAQSSTAQPGATNPVEMADVMRQEGKIYVVVAVILLLFSGFVVYLVRIDRKVSRLEKELPNESL